MITDTTRILLLDDDPFVLELMGHQLAELGFSRVTAMDQAAHALAVLEMEPGAFSVILCDLQMPAMDGIEFVRHLVRLGYDKGLVLMSGENQRILHTAETLARAHRLQVLGALAKPVTLEQLRRVLACRPPREASSPRLVYGPQEVERGIAGGELMLHYQPKVEVATGAVVGFESLARWVHPRDGLVYPDQFITTAEEHGLMDALTRVVLGLAVAQARRWTDIGLDLHMAVNVSMDNLTSLEFADGVAGELKGAGMPPSALLLEVTESRLMKDPQASLDVLTRLSLKRIGLSIDDFGTGHSSLVQLRDIPFGELKVDRGFVHGAAHAPASRAILEASLDMARRLGMQTVAEGVEEREDWELLCGLDCDLAQGYFIARPMPAADVPAWVEAWENGRHLLNEG